MTPRLADLAPYLRRFGPYAGWLGAGLGLAVATLAGSWGLLGVSGAFLTATGLAGLSAATAAVYNVVIPAGAIRLFALVRTASRWAERVINHEATFRLLGDLRVWLYTRFSRLSPRQLGLWHGADVLSRLTRDIDRLDNLFIRLLVPIASSTLVMGALVAVCAAWSPGLALPAAGLALAGLVLGPVVTYLAGRRLSPRLVERQAALRRALLDLVEGLEDSTLHRPAWLRQRDRVTAEDGRRLADEAALQRWGSGSRALLTVLIGLAGGAFLTLVSGLPADRAPDGPWFVALTLLVLGTGEALLGLPGAWLELAGTALAARRLSDLAGQEPRPSYRDDPAFVAPGTVLQARDLSFGYGTDQAVLSGLTFRLEPGDHVALLGPSGEGKTTLVRLLTRLEDPTGGSLTLGGLELKDWPEADLRRVVGGSLQDPWIFHASVAENLRLARPGADLKTLGDMLDLVGLGAQVRAWPAGLATLVQEGGQSLSGGQRRRLALARALLRETAVTILDEPTEGLESAAAADLVAAVRAHLRGRTLLWVTHRPEGLDTFPQVWTLAGGRLQAGTGPR